MTKLASFSTCISNKLYYLANIAHKGWEIYCE